MFTLVEKYILLDTNGSKACVKLLRLLLFNIICWQVYIFFGDNQVSSLPDVCVLFSKNSYNDKVLTAKLHLTVVPFGDLMKCLTIFKWPPTIIKYMDIFCYMFCFLIEDIYNLKKFHTEKKNQINIQRKKPNKIKPQMYKYLALLPRLFSLKFLQYFFFYIGTSQYKVIMAWRC